MPRPKLPTGDAFPATPISVLPPVSEWIDMEAARPLFPSANPGGPTVKTIREWMTKGVATPIGRIRLRGIKSGARRYTTQRWIDEFHQLQTQAAAELPAESLTQEQLLRRQAVLSRGGTDGQRSPEAAASGSVPVRPVRSSGGDARAVEQVLPSGDAIDRRSGTAGDHRGVPDRQPADPSRLPDPPHGLPFRFGTVPSAEPTEQTTE